MKSALISALAIATVAMAAPADAQNLDRRVRIINNTSYTMITF